MMDLCWIRTNSELENGVKIINDVDIKKFQKFLLHVKENSGTRTKSEIFTADETTALERVFKLNAEQVSILIKTSLFILEKMSKFVMRPKNVLCDLVNDLKMEKDKAEAFVVIWRDFLKTVVVDYDIDNFGSNDRLVDVKWDLNLAVSSQLNKKEKLTSILLQMETVNDDKPEIGKTTLEFTKDELLSFNNQLDNVQFEIDTLLTSYIKSN